MSEEPNRPEVRRFATFVQRELTLLIVLAIAGVALFLGTKVLADDNAALRRRDAAAWLANGRAALAAGQVDTALASLERASRVARDDREIALTFASALRASGADQRAAEVLDVLRVRQPDDPDANVELARLEARRGDLTLAIRYYQDALDSLWAPAAVGRARAVREEFINLLLASGQRGRALSQVLVLAADLPPEPEWQARVGRLFLSSGDPRRALVRFTEVLRGAPGNLAALAGAGEAAYALDDFAAATRWLADVPESNTRARDLRAVAEQVMKGDPLAPRLPRSERMRRAEQLAQRARARLTGCTTAGADAQRLAAELDATIEAVTAPGRRPTDEERDLAEDAVSLAAQAERAAAPCAAPEPLDRAIGIIARVRGLEAGR